MSGVTRVRARVYTRARARVRRDALGKAEGWRVQSERREVDAACAVVLA